MDKLKKLFDEMNLNGRFIVCATMLDASGTLQHSLIRFNFPKDDMLKSVVEHKKLIVKEMDREEKKIEENG